MHFLKDHQFEGLCSDQLYDLNTFNWLSQSSQNDNISLEVQEKNCAYSVRKEQKDTTEFSLSAQKQNTWDHHLNSFQPQRPQLSQALTR